MLLSCLWRNVGIPGKGTKKDPISALKDYSITLENGNFMSWYKHTSCSLASAGDMAFVLKVKFAASAGSNSLLAGSDTKPAAKPMQPKSLPSKRKAKFLPVEVDAENMSTVSEITESKGKRSRRKQHPVESTNEDYSSTVITNKKLSAKTKKVQGMFSSSSSSSSSS